MKSYILVMTCMGLIPIFSLGAEGGRNAVNQGGVITGTIISSDAKASIFNPVASPSEMLKNTEQLALSNQFEHALQTIKQIYFLTNASLGELRTARNLQSEMFLR